MSRKTIILFVLTAALATAVLVFGVPHRHAENMDQATSQSPVTAPKVDVSSNSSNAETEALSLPPSDTVRATQPEQGSTSDDSSQPQDDAEVPTPVVREHIVVPAGTGLTVRIGEALGSRVSQVGQRFSATLDRDVVVHGQTVILAGASVTGKVAAVKHVGVLTGEANLQLRLTSVHVNNSNLPAVTSIQSFGAKIKSKNKVGRFVKGLLKRAAGKEKEIVLDDQSVCSFTLLRGLRIQ